jgi:hypothetical protein
MLWPHYPFTKKQILGKLESYLSCFFEIKGWQLEYRMGLCQRNNRGKNLNFLFNLGWFEFPLISYALPMSTCLPMVYLCYGIPKD